MHGAIRCGVKFQQARRKVAPSFNYITAIFMATPPPVGEASCLALFRFYTSHQFGFIPSIIQMRCAIRCGVKHQQVRHKVAPTVYEVGTFEVMFRLPKFIRPVFAPAKYKGRTFRIWL